MLILKIKLVIGCLVLILLVLGACNFSRILNTNAQRQKFSMKLITEIERKRSTNNVVEIRLKDMTDFTWDRVHIFTSYMAVETIDHDLGYTWQPARSIGIYQRDDISLLVFTSNRDVVFYIEQSRYPGDFDGCYKQDGYSPDEAIFRVVEGAKQENGLPWLHLIWKWERP